MLYRKKNLNSNPYFRRVRKQRIVRLRPGIQPILCLETKYEDGIPFPELPPLSERMLLRCLKRITPGKALAFDCFSDIYLRDDEARSVKPDCRPIVFESQLVKLLESLFMTKLEEYQQNEMVPSQTGFVAGGTTVHIVRAIQLIKAPTNRGKVCFGFFIGLKSACNTLYYDRLMQRLGTKFCSLKRCE